MKNTAFNPFGIIPAIILLSVGNAAVILFLEFILDYQFLQGDICLYWEDIQEWRKPFDGWHVPGLSLTVAFLRGITFGLVHPVLLMQLVNAAAIIATTAAIYKSIKFFNAPDSLAFFGACLFGLWPFIGLTYTAHPEADVPAMAFLLTGILYLQHSRIRTAGALLGLAMIFHKAMWPFVFFIFLAYLIRVKTRSWGELLAFLFLSAPLFTVWLGGTLHHNSPLWIVSQSTSVGLEVRESFPIFEGIIGTFQAGGFRGWIKGGLLLFFFGVSISVLVFNLKIKPHFYQYGTALCIVSIFLFVILTHIEIWAAVRFGRLVILPLIWVIIYKYEDNVPWINTKQMGVLLTILMITQFAFAWYISESFYG